MRKFGIISIANTKKRIWSEEELLERVSSSEDHPYVDNELIEANKEKVREMNIGDVERVSVPHGGLWMVACVDIGENDLDIFE